MFDRNQNGEIFHSDCGGAFILSWNCLFYYFIGFRFQKKIKQKPIAPFDIIALSFWVQKNI